MGLSKSLKKLSKPFMSMATLGLIGGAKSGGGSNPGTEQAQAQAAMRAEQDKAIAALNRAFGTYDPMADIGFHDGAAFGGGGFAGKAMGAAANGAESSYTLNGKTIFKDRAEYDAEVARRKAEQGEIMARREANYRTAGDDILNYRRPQLDKQRTDAARKLKFALARTGQVGGSVAIDQGRELTDNYQRGMLDLQNDRLAAINTMKAADEESRINLIGQIRNGMDQSTALQAAQAKTNQAITGARDAGLGKAVQDYFGGMTYLNQQAQLQQGYNDRAAQLRTIFPSANNGTITRT